MNPKTVVVLSGGLDSTVLLHHILDTEGAAAAVSINYGQRHSRELAYATMTCRRLNVDHSVVDLSPLRAVLGRSSQTSDVPVPEGHYAEETMKQTVVPNRNMILLSVAIARAVSIGAERVAYGAHSGDHAIYPDCRPEFVDAMRQAAALCDWSPVDIVAPFVGLTKAEVVAMGNALGVRFDLTWTCYKGQTVHCGRCSTCVERLEAFDLCGLVDPTPYVDTEFWREAVAAHEKVDA